MLPLSDGFPARRFPVVNILLIVAIAAVLGACFLLYRGSRIRTWIFVAPGPGGTSRTPGARALHCAARGILPSPHRKTQDAGADMRIGFVSGKIKIVISYQH
jgi:hypothetical protein